jgi:hypothetical protein
MRLVLAKQSPIRKIPDYRHGRLIIVGLKNGFAAMDQLECGVHHGNR